MSRMLLTKGRTWRVRLVWVLVFAALFVANTSQADEGRPQVWYVKAADGPQNGDGSRLRPFNSLQQVEANTEAGDSIFVLASHRALDGGIQLKNGQKLIGLGDPVTQHDGPGPLLTNTSDARYDGDIIRLAQHNLVANLKLDNAFRSSILGINAVGATLIGNLITNDMAVHDLFDIEGPLPSTCGVDPVAGPVCLGLWPNGFILFASQTNHFGAITLVTCGDGARSAVTNPDVQPLGYCKFLDPTAATVPSTGHILIDGNVIRDSNSDGMMLINDLGVVADFTVTRNIITDLSQGLPDPSAVGLTDHVVRSRAFTIITIEDSLAHLRLNDFEAANLSPNGTFAADGIVFLTSGLDPVTNAKLTDVAVSNPLLSGDFSNGDSIEIQHRGSTNGVLDIDILRAVLSDPASTNIKIIESSNPDNGTYDVTVTDSVLTNINPKGNEDAQIRFNGTARTQVKAINLSLKNVQISGLGRGIGSADPNFQNNVLTFHIKVEDSSLSNLSKDAIFYAHGSAFTIGTVGGAIIDLGGGPLGSQGRNRFVDNGQLPSPPPVLGPGDTIDPLEPEDLDIRNPNAGPPPIQVFAANNDWGGGAPVVGPPPPADVLLSGNVTFTADSLPSVDPE